MFAPSSTELHRGVVRHLKLLQVKCVVISVMYQVLVEQERWHSLETATSVTFVLLLIQQKQRVNLFDLLGIVV